MFIGSENQFRNLYVALANKAKTDAVTTKGDVAVGKSNDGKDVYFLTHNGEQAIRTDLIPVENILEVTHTAAAKMARKLHSYTVTLDADYLVDGKPVVGQDYVLNIEVRNYVALGDDSTHNKFGAVHATSKTTTGVFYAQMAKSLAKSLMREPSPILDIELVGGDNPKVLTKGVYTEPAAAEYTGIKITEVEQPWRRGVAQVEPVNFEVIPSYITVDGDDVIWGVATAVDGASLDNGKMIADMEWFYHGNRADMYRETGYPNNFEFHPLVDETKAYDTLDIHYAWVGSGVDVAKSERTITIVGVKAVLDAVLAAFKTAAPKATVVEY